MMYKYTDHARKRMISRDINEDEIMVGRTFDGDDILILSVYEVKRRWR